MPQGLDGYDSIMARPRGLRPLDPKGLKIHGKRMCCVAEYGVNDTHAVGGCSTKGWSRPVATCLKTTWRLVATGRRRSQTTWRLVATGRRRSQTTWRLVATGRRRSQTTCRLVATGRRKAKATCRLIATGRGRSQVGRDQPCDLLRPGALRPTSHGVSAPPRITYDRKAILQEGTRRMFVGRMFVVCLPNFQEGTRRTFGECLPRS